MYAAHSAASSSSSAIAATGALNEATRAKHEEDNDDDDDDAKEADDAAAVAAVAAGARNAARGAEKPAATRSGLRSTGAGADAGAASESASSCAGAGDAERERSVASARSSDMGGSSEAQGRDVKEMERRSERRNRWGERILGVSCADMQLVALSMLSHTHTLPPASGSNDATSLTIGGRSGCGGDGGGEFISTVTWDGMDARAMFQ